MQLGFGKSRATNCVWLGGITAMVTERYLGKEFGRFGPVNYATIDRSSGRALVCFDDEDCAQGAVNEMRGCNKQHEVKSKKLHVSGSVQ